MVLDFDLDIQHCYSIVLQGISDTSGVSDEDIARGILYLKQALGYTSQSLTNDVHGTVDFETPANRAAYVFKNASFHAGMTYELLSAALQHLPRPFERIEVSLQSPFQLVSLGGGPGSDVIGATTALFNFFGLLNIKATIIDIAPFWEEELSCVVDAIMNGDYGSFSQQFDYPYFSWSFLTADLLQDLDESVKNSIHNAHLITMVKFVSSAACKDADKMLKRIFRSMRSGGLVLSIEISGGGFAELVLTTAAESGLQPLLGHIVNYKKTSYRKKRFDSETNWHSKVAVNLLVKLDPVPGA